LTAGRREAEREGLVRLAEAALPGWRRSSSGRYDHLGALFALLLAEQPFVPGCRVSVTMTPAGTIALAAPSPYLASISQKARRRAAPFRSR